MSSTNASRLLWASFLTIFAAGVGFSVRTELIDVWGSQFGFTKTELGSITGGGLVGFGIIIILFSLIADKIGYGKLLALAFFTHVASAVLLIAAGPVFKAYGKDACYWCLYLGCFVFSIANGTCEAVVNPLVATLFPKEKTHYLNILHAGWPAGLVTGALISFFAGHNLAWEVKAGMFLIPAVIYGVMLLGQKFPASEAVAAGTSIGQMISSLFAPMLLFLLFIHAMVGYVELGTDSWISSITDLILPGNGLLLFVYASVMMTVLRFFAGPIVHKISPIGLLLACAIFGFTGLYLLGTFKTGVAIIVAMTIYSLGKTFFWPTMLAVVSERFPRGGAVTMGFMGGVGMLSAGLIGAPAIGYKQDYFASEKLKETSPALYEKYKAEKPNSVLGLKPITGLDGGKVGALLGQKPEALNEADKAAIAPVKEARLHGGQTALRYTAIVPFLMAVCYLILALYFRSQGGYKAVELPGAPPAAGH